MPLTSDYTVVDIQAIRDKASAGAQKVSQFNEALDRLDEAMRGTESYWEGDAANLYREVYRIEMERLREDFAAYAEYVDELNAYADLYEGVEHRAETLANGIEQAVWAEV